MHTKIDDKFCCFILFFSSEADSTILHKIVVLIFFLGVGVLYVNMYECCYSQDFFSFSPSFNNNNKIHLTNVVSIQSQEK